MTDTNELDCLRAEHAEMREQRDAAVRHAESLAGLVETHEASKGQDQCNAMDAWGENERLKGEAATARQERDEAKAALERAQADLAQMTATADSLRAALAQPAA